MKTYEREILTLVDDGLKMTIEELWQLSILYNTEIIIDAGIPKYLAGYEEVCDRTDE